MKFYTHVTPLTLGESRLSQFAFDGQFYYFTTFCQGKIIQTTTEFCPIREIETCRDYECLCFDQESCCFWASVSGSGGRLFQLDCQMREISCLTLSGHFPGKITGLSYHNCLDGIFVAYPTGVGIFHKESEEFQPLPAVYGMVTTVLAVCPGYFVLSRRGKEQYLTSFFDTGEKITQSMLSISMAVQGLCYNPCHCDTPRLDILLRDRGCYPALSSLAVTAYELGFEPCICNHKICQHCCTMPSNCSPIDDVIESIALVEAALSHILNAQGEELQKVVASSDSVEEMLEVNAQINKTITKVTHLEQVLYSKLEELSELAGIQEDVKRNCCHKLSAQLIE